MPAVKKTLTVSQLKRAQIEELLAQSKRLDGRDLLQHRPLNIELGIIEKASGSARVTLGDTQVIAGVKVETGKPYPDSPDKALLIVTADILPASSPFVEPGPPSEDSIELARVSDRGVRESGMIDVSKLVIQEGELVYTVFMDVAVINEAGGLFDAASYAIVTALSLAKMSKFKIKNDKVEMLEDTAPLPITTLPIATTFAKIGGKIILDPTSEEEAIMDARLTLVTDSNGNFVAGQKGRPGLFTIEEMP